MALNPRTAYFNAQQLSLHFGVTAVTIWRWVKTNDFPEPVKLSPQMTKWRRQEVEAWEAARSTDTAERGPDQ